MLRPASSAMRVMMPRTASVLPSVSAAADVQARGMAVSLQDLKKRIVATGNVAKLTGVMKLVASSKLAAVQQALEDAQGFGKSLMDSVALDKNSDAVGAEELTALEDGVEGKKRLVVVMTTDRGLCGSVNSSMVRFADAKLQQWSDAGEKLEVILLGEKGRAQLAHWNEVTVGAIDQCFDRDPVFDLAGAVGERIVSRDFDDVTLFYNHFVNAASFDNTYDSFPQMANLEAGQVPASFKEYEIDAENDEIWLDMTEFSLAGALYYAMLENQTCEISQRVTAMDNASTNAKDMVDSLTLLYNRARQAKITTELTEIISGAESLEDGE